jgi:anti-sigma B factor antagonist
VETAIGIFSSRERATEAVHELLKGKVPEESIVFLTRSQTEAEVVGKELGATVGGFMGVGTGMSAGVLAATMLAVPGIGPVFALGFGAAALLGLFGAGVGSALGKSMSGRADTVQPTEEEQAPDDVTFFREVLQEGRTLIVVRTESQEIAKAACGILDRLGLGIEGRTPLKMQTANRQVGDVSIVDVSGRITLGEGNFMLREVVRELVDKGNNKILLNLHEVGYVDSSGLGELVKTYTTVRNQGGQLKLLNPSKRVSDLLQMTKLARVFEIEADEASAIQSFTRAAESAAPAK